MKNQIKFNKNCFDEILTHHSCIAIFGAGQWGRYIAKTILQKKKDINLIFCDNSKDLQGRKVNGIEIVPVDTAITVKNIIFIVSFLKNHQDNLSNAYSQLINYGVAEEQIYLIDQNDLLKTSEEDSLKQTWKYITELINLNFKKENIHEIKKIKSLVYRYKPLKDSINGPSGVMNVQEQALGNHIGNIELEYFYKDANYIFNPENRQSYITDAIDFARKFENDKDTVYIAHDIFSAFGLYTIGKYYTVIYHNQGAIEYEAENMGRRLSYGEKDLINYIERIAAKNAFRICFPSSGAEKFFFQTLGETKPEQYKRYTPLYNTMIWHVEMEQVAQLEALKDTVTFFGTGQLTKAKGMDRIPAFINKLSSETDKKIRLILVGTGPCKNQIDNDMQKITEEHPNISYYHFDHLRHSQIRYILHISDIYLMLHRVSIFDIATLEAMEAGLEVILSDIPGNTDFNKENNIILLNPDRNTISLEELIKMKDKYGKRNKEVFYKYFSISNFKRKYLSLMKEFEENLA